MKLYRAMRADGQRPEQGVTGQHLGARLAIDICPIEGFVVPRTGGMSVTPEDPMLLPARLRPASLGGTGITPLFVIHTDRLPDRLKYRPDSERSDHGLLEPARKMAFDEYQGAVWSTRDSWELIE